MSNVTPVQSHPLLRQIAPIDYDARMKSLQEMTVPELRAELANILGLTAQNLLRLAAVWTELEKRGEDLSELRSGIMAYLPRIAAGTLLPETVVRFAGHPVLLRLVSALSLDSQREIVEGKPLLLVVPGESGSWTHRLLPAHVLTPWQIRQVFGDGHVRGEAEQIALLTSARTPVPPKAVRSPRRGQLRYDSRADAIFFGRHRIDIGDAVSAVADAKRPVLEEPGPDAVDVSFKVSSAERESIRKRAAEANLSISAYLRKVAIMAGAI